MKRQTLIVITIAFMFLIPSLFGILGVTETHTQGGQDPVQNYSISDVDWLEGYRYRKSHTITGSVGAETDYQILINITRATGTDSGNTSFVDTKCQTDFEDIRFTDDDKVTELDYWREVNTTNYALFWVEISDDLDSEQMIYVYYGNDAVSDTSDGDATFLFYEDWNSHSLRTAVWDEQYANGDIQYHDVLDGADEWYGETAHGRWLAEVIGGTGTDFELIESDLHISAPFATRFRSYIEETAAASQRTIQGSGSAWDVLVPVSLIWSDAGTNSLLVRDDGGNDDSQLMVSDWFDDFYTFETVRDGTNVYLYAEGALIETGDIDPDSTSTNVAGIGVRDSEYQVFSDWIFTRKYIPTEPSHSTWGSEEEDDRGWHCFTMEPIYFDLPGWNDFTMENIRFFIPFGELSIPYLLMLCGLVMIPASTLLLVIGGRAELSRDKLFLFFLMFLFGWALFLGGIL